MPRTEVVNTLLREEMRVLHGSYENMNGLLRYVAKLKKANDNKDRLVKEVESSRQATEAEFGQLKEHIIELESEMKDLKRDSEKSQTPSIKLNI
ncbi:hypothetical protein CDL15_Pgr015039 [Punica granatum]|uniref:Uncharacterized protein n=1 Tax=Punica granatum TaxID=22663 RepID=A0A218X0P4_PUNGR|nr:hypothetical protein CDL15_Pgr015039 [Punica granatum]